MALKEKLVELNKISKERLSIIERNKRIWIQEVNKLFENIEDWFNEYIQDEYMHIEYETLQEAECEEFFEHVNMMYLHLGGEYGPSIVFNPTGINVAGALGKMDLYFRGHINERIFLLLIEDENEKFHWEILKSNMGNGKFTIFDKEILESIINEWLDKWTDILKG